MNGRSGISLLLLAALGGCADSVDLAAGEGAAEGTARATQAASVCRSLYDSDSNNSYTETAYFMGPMTIPLNADISGSIDAQGDADYYKFIPSVSGRITLTLTNLPANYDLRLVNSLGATLVTSARSGTTSEVINFTATGGVTYFALVYPSSRRTFNAAACYVLRVAG
jgi:hypothetical protein